MQEVPNKDNVNQSVKLNPEFVAKANFSVTHTFIRESEQLPTGYI